MLNKILIVSLRPGACPHAPVTKKEYNEEKMFRTFVKMRWLTNIFSILFPAKEIINSNSGKSFDQQYQGSGAFQYEEDGFTVQYEGVTKQVRWSDITQLNVYKVDLMTNDEIEMEIVCGDGRFVITEELPGWYQFVLKTKEIFPAIPKDWDGEIIQPPFATNYRTIYDKKEA